MNSKPIHVKPAMYALFYEDLKIIAKDNGYNLVLHGSMNRDLDLIAIPWVDNPTDQFHLVKLFDEYFRGDSYKSKEYYLHSILPGYRSSYVISLNRGDRNGE